MTELSNAVTVLIARMESHPEDFGPGGKFAGVADGLYGVLGLVQDIPRSAYWFLTDADKEALIEAWKKYHRTAMEKEVMEKIFDDGEGERERVKQQQRAHIRAQLQNQMLASTGTYQTTTIKPGQLQPITNPAQNSTGITSAHTGLFGGVFK